jgi:putative transposase
VVENLNVAGMLRNRKLARHIADAGWGTLLRLLEYKTTWRGSTLHVADRWFASSKTCSACGTTKTKLPLQIRIFRCEHCNLVLDRDVNAARNLAQLVTGLGESGTGVAGDPTPPGVNGRPSRHKTRPSQAAGIEASTLRRASA